MKVVFSHGKESGPWGTKIRALADLAKDLGHSVDSLDYTDTMDPDQRVSRLTSYLEKETSEVVLVGSSMGGYVSIVAASQLETQGVFALAPALFIPGWKHQSYPVLSENIEIVHGWSDEIVPHELSIRYARESNTTLHLIEGDHRLNSSLDEVLRLFKAFLLKL